MWTLLRRSRYLLQYRRVVTTLTRHGLGWLADQAGLSRLFTWPRRLFRRALAPQPLPSLAQRLCQALEQLGPTFVLLGRYLSTRADLLSPELCQELDCLPAGGPGMPPDDVTRIVEEGLGRPLEELFPSFTPQPWRCNWLAQTHHALTSQGREVWVTVLNPWARSRLEQDLPLLRELARMIDEARPRERWWSACEIERHFEEAMHRAFDVREQGHNAGRWKHHFGDRGDVVFPKVEWELTTTGVLTCQALSGRPIEEAAQDRQDEGDDLVRAMDRFFGQAIFRDGFYPAPPPLGQLFVLRDGRLAVTSLAPVGQLDSSVRQDLLRLLEHFQAERVDGIIEAALSLGLVGGRHVPTVVHQAIRHIIERYRDLPLAEMQMRELAGDILALVERSAITMPEELSLLLCALVAVEDLGRRLAPQVSMAQEMAPLIQEAIAAQHSWPSRQERLLRAGRAWLEALGSLPSDMRGLLSQAVQGDLSIGVEPRGWQGLMRRLERMVYRLVLSVVAAGLLVAFALIVTALLPATWGPWGWILAGLALFSLLGMGVLLVLSFLRRGM